MKKNIDISNKGFSLLEMTIVIIIITILTSTAIPALTRDYLEKAATKTALDMSTIQEAARSYYINTGVWPGATSGNPMGDLTGGNYLPSTWSAINPFGNSYNVSSNATTLTVSSYVPATAQPIIQNLLPTNWVSGNSVYSQVTAPGGVIHSFGTPIPISSGKIYYAGSDGFLEGSVFTDYNLVGFDVLSDSNPAPSTQLPDCNEGTYSSGNGGYPLQIMVHCLLYKGNYYQFNLQNGQGATVNFVPLNS